MKPMLNDKYFPNEAIRIDFNPRNRIITCKRHNWRVNVKRHAPSYRSLLARDRAVFTTQRRNYTRPALARLHNTDIGERLLRFEQSSACGQPPGVVIDFSRSLQQSPSTPVSSAKNGRTALAFSVKNI